MAEKLLASEEGQCHVKLVYCLLGESVSTAVGMEVRH